jgi:enoyl-[acyl-carrier protein] reductase I
MQNGLLAGKTGIITGALDERSIAWKVAVKCVEQGAKIILSNAPVALRMGKINELAEQTGAEIIGCDVSNDEDVASLISQSKEHFGGSFDFLLHSIGMSLNVRKNRHYTNLKYDWTHKTFDISSISFHKMLQECYNQDAINEGGSVLGLTYIAAQRVFPDYNEMADAKSLLESIARSFGYHYGVKNKVRVNTISQSPTVTTAGSGVKGFDGFVNYADQMSPLGNADAESCADYCITMFSDLTRMVTMQNLFHDGGYSNTGVSQAVMDKFSEE